MSSIGHTPILPIQNSIIMTIFTTAGVVIFMNSGPIPMFPIADADITYATWISFVKMSMIVALTMNIIM